MSSRGESVFSLLQIIALPLPFRDTFDQGRKIQRRGFSLKIPGEIGRHEVHPRSVSAGRLPVIDRGEKEEEIRQRLRVCRRGELVLRDSR